MARHAAQTSDTHQPAHTALRRGQGTGGNPSGLQKAFCFFISVFRMEGNHSVCGASMNINPNFCIFNRTQSLCLIYDPIFHSTQVSDHTKDYQLRSKPQTCKIAALGFCRTPICFLSPIRHHFWRSNLRAPERIRHLLFLHINWAINCYWEKIP